MLSIEIIPEYELKKRQQQSIISLIRACFPYYPNDRTYLKQLPSFRILAIEDNKVIGHAAAEYRMVRLEKDIVKIIGLTDICVDPAHQSNLIGSKILSKAEQLAKSNNTDFILLTAGKKEIYNKNGFRSVRNICRWLILNEHETYGVGHRNIGAALMIKPISGKSWSKGLLDLLGHVF